MLKENEVVNADFYIEKNVKNSKSRNNKKAVRSKKSRARLRALILQTTFMGMLLIASTYAWFTTQKDVSISNLKGTVEVAESMEISLDAKNWAQEIDLSTVNLLQATSGSNLGAYRAGVNVAPKEMLPVSTVGDSIGEAKLNMYSGTANGTKLSDVVTCDETETDVAQTDYAGYYAFDLFIRNTSKDSTADTLQLNTNSIVQVLQNSSTNPFVNPYGEANKTYVGNAESGLQNTVRIGFALYNNTADATADTDTILTNTVDTANTIKDIAIWEPNSEAHVDYIKANNNNIKLNGTAFDFTQTANLQHTTYGVNKDAVSNDIENVYVWGTGNSFVSAQNTVQTTSGAVDSVVNITNVSNGNFQIEANKVSRLRIYVWLEGQDVDCINWASYGGGIEATIGLIKDEEVDVSGGEGGGGGVVTPTESLATQIEATNYGEYVEYSKDLNGDGNLRNDWRIFYEDGSNDVYIIAADYLPNTWNENSTMSKNTSGDCATYCSNWSSPSSLGLSLDASSKYMISKAGTFTPTTNNNYQATASLLTTSYWTNLVDSTVADIAIGSPTIEMWMSSWNEIYPTDMLYCNNADSTGYYVGTTDTPTSYSISSSVMKEKAGYNNTLFYPHQTNDNLDGTDSGDCNGYWLASPSASLTNDVLRVGYDGYVNGGYYGFSRLAVRPVVSLKSGVLGSKDGTAWVLGTN